MTKKKKKKTTTISLGLCELCAAAAHDSRSFVYREGWLRLPKFCAECEAKVAQAVRLLTSGETHGFVLVPRKEVRSLTEGPPDRILELVR